MTREEAYDYAMRACDSTWNNKVCADIRKALEQEPCDAISRAELATKTCNKQVVSKLEDAELARDSEEICNNKQVLSKLVTSEEKE